MWILHGLFTCVLVATSSTLSMANIRLCGYCMVCSLVCLVGVGEHYQNKSVHCCHIQFVTCDVTSIWCIVQAVFPQYIATCLVSSYCVSHGLSYRPLCYIRTCHYKASIPTWQSLPKQAPKPAGCQCKPSLWTSWVCQDQQWPPRLWTWLRSMASPVRRGWALVLLMDALSGLMALSLLLSLLPCTRRYMPVLLCCLPCNVVL